MYHPSYLLSKTILKIQTAQRSAVLPLVEHLRVSLECAEGKIANGALVGDEPMINEGYRLSAEYIEQLRILENITPEAQAEFEASL